MLNKSSPGDRDKMRMTSRAHNYGKLESEVKQELTKLLSKLRWKNLRELQIEVKEQFNLITDRAAWRTKKGIILWFCMHWRKIATYIREKTDLKLVKEESTSSVSESETQEEEEEDVHSISINEVDKFLFTFDQTSEILDFDLDFKNMSIFDGDEFVF